jgi:hypothetical protein
MRSYLEKTITKKAGRVVQGEGPESSPGTAKQQQQKNKKIKKQKQKTRSRHSTDPRGKESYPQGKQFLPPGGH